MFSLCKVCWIRVIKLAKSNLCTTEPEMNIMNINAFFVRKPNTLDTLSRALEVETLSFIMIQTHKFSHVYKRSISRQSVKIPFHLGVIKLFEYRTIKYLASLKYPRKTPAVQTAVTRGSICNVCKIMALLVLVKILFFLGFRGKYHTASVYVIVIPWFSYTMIHLHVLGIIQPLNIHLCGR